MLTYKVKEFQVQIYRDADASNPRDDEENVTVIAIPNVFMESWRPEYGTSVASKINLGDDVMLPFFIGEDAMNNLRRYIVRKYNVYAIYPLYLDNTMHIRISHLWPQDKRVIGFIYAPRDKVYKALGIKRHKKSIHPFVEARVETELAEYNKYINDETYEYQITCQGYIIDTCGGWNTVSEALADATNNINSEIYPWE